MKYGRKVRLCPCDRKPWCRPPSPLDGDFDCGDEIVSGFGLEEGKEIELRPFCERFSRERLSREVMK
jgi:hypothetical protein